MEALLVTFGLGLGSAASPCLLPLYPAYLAYLEQSRPLLAHDPEIFMLSLRWTKGIG